MDTGFVWILVSPDLPTSPHLGSIMAVRSVSTTEDMAATGSVTVSAMSTTAETVTMRTGGLRPATMTSTTTGDREQRREIEAEKIIIDTKVIMTGGAAAGMRTGADTATTRAPPVGGQPRPEHSRHIEGQTTENQNGESFQSSKTR